MPTTDKQALLAAAYRLLAQIEPATTSFQVTIQSADGEVQLSLVGRSLEYQSPNGLQLNTRQRTILTAFGEDTDTLTTEAIVRLTGYRNNSQLRAALAEMVQIGLLENDPDGGYRIVR